MILLAHTKLELCLICNRFYQYFQFQLGRNLRRLHWLYLVVISSSKINFRINSVK